MQLFGFWSTPIATVGELVCLYRVFVHLSSDSYISFPKQKEHDQ